VAFVVTGSFFGAVVDLNRWDAEWDEVAEWGGWWGMRLAMVYWVGTSLVCRRYSSNHTLLFRTLKSAVGHGGTQQIPFWRLGISSRHTGLRSN